MEAEFSKKIKGLHGPGAKHNANHGYRPEIDGLRAIAIVAVIINHFNPNILPGGFLGVDIFFVISGYVITKSLQRNNQKNLKRLLTNFYQRRIKRLFPALAICLVITGLAISVVNPQPIQSLRTGLTATFGASNIYLLKNSTNYFAQASELNPFLHTWSLGVEEQFYLIYPILFWIFSNGNDNKNNLRKLTGILCLLSGLSLSIYLAMQSINPDAAYFSMPFRFWEMAAGCLLCSSISSSKAADLNLKVCEWTATGACLSLIGLFFIPNSLIAASTLICVMSTSLFIWTSDREVSVKFLLSRRWITYVGIISYSLYLWHWPILSIARWTVGVSVQTTPILVVLIILMAVGSYHFIEQPLRYRSWGRTPVRELLHGLLTILITAASMQGLIKLSPTIYKITNTTTSKHGGQEAPIPWGQEAPETKELISNCHISNNAGINNKRLTDCLTNQSRYPQKRAFVLGDSHAANHFFGIQNGLAEFSTGLYTIGWGCGFVPDTAANNIKKLDCKKYVSLVKDFLSNNTLPGDVVFIGMRWVHKKLFAPEIQRDLDNLAKVLDLNGARLVLLDDVAELPDPNLCTERWYRPVSSSNPLCQKSIEQVNNELEGLSKLGQYLSSQHQNFSFIKLRDALCEDGECRVYNGNIPLYIDNGHITVSSSRRNAILFKEHIKQLQKADE